MNPPPVLLASPRPAGGREAAGSFSRGDGSGRFLQRLRLPAAGVFFAIGVLGSAARAGTPTVGLDDPPLEVVFQLPLAPSGLTVAPDGAFVLGISFEEKPLNRVVAVNKKGESRPFPSEGVSQAEGGDPLQLDAVEGLHTDKDGLVWMVDNGRRSELPPKLVAWDFDQGRLERVFNLAAPAVLPDSLLHDLAVDPGASFACLSDAANGVDAALIVVDTRTGLARRVLQGHPSVVPEEGTQLEIDGQRHQMVRLDGSVANSQGGVAAIALDRKGEWLYFGPMRSRRLYRVRAEHLRNASLSSAQLAGLVEEYATKPVCNGISLDNKGNIYVSDVSAKGIGMIAAGTKQYRLLATDSRVQWPDGLCFGTDGKLYFFTNSRKGRLRETSSLVSSTETPPTNYLFRLQTPASGRVGD